jgi:hypothetical protein
MALRAPGRDNHVITERSLARQVYADNIVSLGVIERFDDEVGEGGGSREGAFCAARFEFCELMIESLWPQRNNPFLLYCSGCASGSTLRQRKCALHLLNFQDGSLKRLSCNEESTQRSLN